MESISKATVRRRNRISEVMTSLTGGALAVSIVLIFALFVLVSVRGFAHFWPDELVEFTLSDGRVVLGEIHQRQLEPDAESGQLNLKVGNRDVTGLDFLWIDETDITQRRRPGGATVFERLEWGNFHGRMVELRRGDEVLAGPDQVEAAFAKLHPEKRADRERLIDFEHGEIGEVNDAIEELRLERRRIELAELPAAEAARRNARLD
ncbi:MAG: hypothetical protein HKP30_14770, partial [Myxococcales bacterium]|nr:hypothetical protein [Myxococcales bacterium]